MRSVTRVLFALLVLWNCHNPPKRISKRRIWGKLLGWVCSKLTTLKIGHCECTHARGSATRSQISRSGLSTIGVSRPLCVRGTPKLVQYQLARGAGHSISASLAFALFNQPLSRSASLETLMRAFLAQVADLQKRSRE